jgi:AraC-like DNA-binding protein
MTKTSGKSRTKQLYVNSSPAKLLAEYLLLKGLKKNALNKVLECEYEALDSADFRLEISAYHKLWQLGIDYTSDPRLGLKLASNPHNSEMGLVAHIFFNSPTLLDGLKQYQRYYTLVNEGMHIDIRSDLKFSYLDYLCDYDDIYCVADMEHTLALSVLRVQDHINQKLDLEAVHFQHPAPGNIDDFKDIFNCPIKFNQKCCTLIFKKSYLDYKLPKRSAYLYKLLTKHIEGLSTKLLPKQSFTDSVRKVLERQLSKDSVDAENIACKLHMSRHTLYRRLKQEGISFHDLLDQIREDQAYAYLDKGQHSLSDITFLLGFSELSAFSRAFKRWTGISPAKYLKSQKSK